VTEALVLVVPACTYSSSSSSKLCTYQSRKCLVAGKAQLCSDCLQGPIHHSQMVPKCKGAHAGHPHC
jgi:hypothetical protein